MVIVEVFSGLDRLPIHEYRDFIRRNPQIKIVSVNVLKHDWILLTYEN